METPRAKPKLPPNPGSADADRLVSAACVDDDQAFELKLRPTRLSEPYFGFHYKLVAGVIVRNSLKSWSRSLE